MASPESSKVSVAVRVRWYVVVFISTQSFSLLYNCTYTHFTYNDPIFHSFNQAEIDAACGSALVVHPETAQVQAGIKQYAFDRVFSELQTQQDVHEISVKPLGSCFPAVHSIAPGLSSTGFTMKLHPPPPPSSTADPTTVSQFVEGINATVLAYGQTGRYV